MFGFFFTLVAIAVLGALGIWLSSEGLLEDSLMIVVGIDLLLLIFAGPIWVLQKISPPQEE